jgi:polysaccharide deacetylase family protein (PEP-CTERM system associated)
VITAAPPTVHHFTVDVEEYFQVSAFEPSVRRESWGGFESRVERSVSQLLELLGISGAQATFFVLGWTAERSPHVVRQIAEAGHEVASHGWDHRRIDDQTPDEFRTSVRRSKSVLEELTGRSVQGFRAPNFSIVPGSEWALDVLVEEGYAYDSSLFPVRRPGYGYPNGVRDPHWLQRPSGRLAEVPPATLRRFGLNLPAAGGAYFRLLPYGVVRAAIKDFEVRGVPATFYIHPWELDPDQPRLDVSWLTRLRHYGGLRNTASRVRRLLREFRFRPIASTVADL